MGRACCASVWALLKLEAPEFQAHRLNVLHCRRFPLVFQQVAREVAAFDQR